jgi:hypothetical protein
MDRGAHGLREGVTSLLVGLAAVALLVGAGVLVAILAADQLVLRARNSTGAEVTISGCGAPLVVPAGATREATRSCWRARALQARSAGAEVDRVAVPRPGSYLYDVGGRGGLLLVDYSAAYAQANDVRLPPEAEARVVADLRATRLVSLPRGPAVLEPNAPLPGERVVGSRVLRLERAPAPELDAAGLRRHFSERMREELTPASLRPVRLDFHPAPKDAGR